MLVQPKIPIYTQQTAAEDFRKCFSKEYLHDTLLELCLLTFEEIHGNRESQLPKRSTSELIEWYLSHNTFDEKNQTWKTYNPYTRIERSDIYYELCGWIK